MKMYMNFCFSICYIKSEDTLFSATSGTDESARIWNFLSKEVPDCKTKKRCHETRQLHSNLHLNKGFGRSLR